MWAQCNHMGPWKKREAGSPESEKGPGEGRDKQRVRNRGRKRD